MKALMDSRAFNVKLGTVMWGCTRERRLRSSARVASSLSRALGSGWLHPDTGGWPNYLNLLRDWFNRDNERIYRSYHSESRVPPDPLNDPHAVWKDLLRSGIKLKRRQEAPGRWAQILQNERWTSARMSDSYVNYGPGTDNLLFLDAHHTMPRIGFSHAAGVTSVGK